MTLTWKGDPYEYEIDLETCTSSAEVLDWIVQVAHKTWVGKEDLADLIAAFDALFQLQAHFCSSGIEQNPNPVALLIRRKAAAMRTISD